MKKKSHLKCWTVAVLYCVFGLQAIGPSAFAKQANGKGRAISSTAGPSQAEVSRAIALAGKYLEGSCRADGKFIYRVDFRSGKEIPSYNVVRHAGAIYALAMLNERHPDPQVVATMVRATDFLRQNYIGSDVVAGQLVVWSQPLRERNGTQYPVAELGGSALGVIALAAVEQAKPKSVSLDDMKALGHFMMSLQRADGSFVGKYREGVGPVTDLETLYYPGEAALAFVTLYEIDHSPEWLNAASNALAYLAKSRAGLSVIPADHWALIATARLLPYCDKGACPVSRDELVQHAIQICNSMLRDEIRDSPNPLLQGAFEPYGRTTPTATRLEGLLAALEFLPKGELRTEIEAAVNRGITFLLRTQIASGQYAGGMPGVVFGTTPRNETEIRIDYVQHALSAWIRYQQLFQGKLQPQDHK